MNRVLRTQKKMSVETTGIFIFDENECFLVCHPTYSSGNSWSIPKGIPEPKETYEQAAIRELREETGIILTDDQIQRIAFVGEYKYPDKDKVLLAHVLMLDGDPVPTDLKCESMVSYDWFNVRTQEMSHTEFPEVDGYFWMDINQSIMVNCSQKEALTRIIKNYNLNYNTKMWLGGEV